MKKIAIFLVCFAVLAAAFVGGTVAYTVQASVDAQTHTSDQVDIAFENKNLTSPVRVLPGSTAEKTVKIKNLQDSGAVWVWCSVTVPAAEGKALVQPGGMGAGWEVLNTVSQADTVTYTYGYTQALAPGDTTSSGISTLTFSGGIDYLDGSYHLVENGEPIPITGVSDGFFVHFDAYATEVTDGITSVTAAYEAAGQ